MEPAIWTKQTWDERLLEFDATDALATGDSVKAGSVVDVTVWEGITDMTATMFVGPASIVGNKVYAKIIGGTDTHSYWVRIRVLTTNGDKIEDDLRLLVRNVGG
jgi:hypothetical protein